LQIFDYNRFVAKRYGYNGGVTVFEVFLANTVVVAAAVLIHYKFLSRITQFLPRMQLKHELRIVFGVFCALIAHTVEVWCFAIAYYLMHHADDWGSLTGDFTGSFIDCVYFSFTVFSTLGFGDIEPEGDLRYLTGIESLTGLVLITWTASFLLLEMQRNWKMK
jgi:hypothetical protein